MSGRGKGNVSQETKGIERREEREAGTEECVSALDCCGLWILA